MTSILFLLLSILVIQECWGIPTPYKGCRKGEKFLEDATNMIAKAQESFRTCLNGDCNNSRNPRDCKELLKLGYEKSGNYTIWLRTTSLEEKPISVYCDMETAGGGWTVIQRRGDYDKFDDDFNKNWNSYKEGFGDIQKEFWLGNENIFDLTNQKVYSVRFDLKAFNGQNAYAEYISFFIDGEDNNYMIHIKNYTGNAGDAMKDHDGARFSTPEKDNDSSYQNCAKEFQSGWWFNGCYSANLNGRRNWMYTASNVNWVPFQGHSGLHSAEIKIRPRS